MAVSNETKYARSANLRQRELPLPQDPGDVGRHQTPAVGLARWHRLCPGHA